MRKHIVFKLNDEIVLVEKRDLMLSEVDEMKNIIAQECECDVNDIDIETIDEVKDLSELDVIGGGLVYWSALYPKIIGGVELLIDMGSDDYLDAMNKGSLNDFVDEYILLK